MSPRGIDAERVERVRQLEPAARHERHRPRAQPQLGARVDQIARLVDGPIARQHLAGQDQRPRLFARGGQPLLDQRQVRTQALGGRAVRAGRSHGGMIAPRQRADVRANT